MNTPEQSRRARARWRSAIVKVSVATTFSQPVRKKKSLRRRLSRKMFSVQANDHDEVDPMQELVTKFHLRGQDATLGSATTAKTEMEQESDWAQQACILHHQSPFRVCWDYTMFGLICYLMISIPYDVAFVEPSDEWTFWSVLNIFIDVLFWCDILLTFNTTYKDGQQFVTDRKRIAKRYLKCWFWIDLCAALPLDVILTGLIMGTVDNTKAFKLVKSVRLLRQLRMLKLLRLMRIARMLRSKTKMSYAVSRTTTIFKMVRLVGFVLVLAHFMACIWFSLTDTTDPDGGFLANHFFEQPETIYLRTLYHTIAMLISDQGGVEPITTTDFVFCSACMILGAVAISIVFGQMALIISNMNAQKSVFQKKMENIHTSMKYLGLPATLRQRVFKYYRTLWEKHRSVQPNLGWFVSELSENLQAEVVLCLRKDVLEGSTTFARCSSNEVMSVIMAMKRLFFLKNDIIVRRGTSRGIFVVHSGDVNMKSQRFQKGDSFSTGPVVAMSACEVLWLPTEEVARLERRFPGFENRVQLTKKRTVRVTPARKVNA